MLIVTKKTAKRAPKVSPAVALGCRAAIARSGAVGRPPTNPASKIQPDDPPPSARARQAADKRQPPITSVR